MIQEILLCMFISCAGGVFVGFFIGAEWATKNKNK